jgi:hypothetical protein
MLTLPGILRIAPNWSSFIRQFKLRTLTTWHATNEPEQGSHNIQFSLWPNLNLNPICAAPIPFRLRVADFLSIARLASGHNYMNTFKACFRPKPGTIVTSPACQCGFPSQTASHVICKCPLAEEFRWLLPNNIRNHTGRPCLDRLVDTPNRCICMAQFIRTSLAFTGDYPRLGDPPTPEEVGEDQGAVVYDPHYNF